jgi:hypothetical protein
VVIRNVARLKCSGQLASYFGAAGTFELNLLPKISPQRLLGRSLVCPLGIFVILSL